MAGAYVKLFFWLVGIGIGIAGVIYDTTTLVVLGLIVALPVIE